MVAMGAETLMEEDKGDGTVMGGLFFFPRALGTLSLRSVLSLRVGFLCPLVVLQTMKVSEFLVFSAVVGLRL